MSAPGRPSCALLRAVICWAAVASGWRPNQRSCCEPKWSRATVRLAGTYGLFSELIDFDGTVRMQATVSEAAGGGVKGLLLKAIDPLFRSVLATPIMPFLCRPT